jgi:tetratricopeptide (TPR) repeat protein
MKNPEAAIEAYEKAVTICPIYADCFFNMGNIYYEGDCSQGVPDLDRALHCHQKALECLEETLRLQ